LAALKLIEHLAEYSVAEVSLAFDSTILSDLTD